MTEVAREQHGWGHRVAILLVSGGADAGMTRRLPDQVPVVSVPCVSRWGRLRVLNLFGIVQVCWLLRRCRPDVVHTHLFLGHTVGRVAAVIAGVPVVSTEHSTSNILAQRGARTLHSVLRPLSRQMLAVSEAVAQSWHDAGYDFLVTVPGGSVPPPRSRPATSPYTVGVVARLVRDKGVDVVVRALQHLPASWRLVVVGDGPEHATLTALTQELGLSARVEWVGAQDALDWYPFFDVLASAATREGHGLAVGEALAAGLPVVLSHLPAHLGWQEKGGNRVTLLGTRDPEQWAQALAEAARTLSPTGRDLDLVMTSWRAHAEQILHVYADVLRPKGMA